MKISVEEITETNIRFTIYSGYSFANSLRRILLGEVVTTAIDFIEIRENKSVLADEILANRLGLIPIACSKQPLLKDECDCDSYCERCSYRLSLKVKNTGNKVMVVTGKDVISEDSGVVCFGSLLVKLAPGESLDISCIARRDSPQSHAKYSPVTAVGFKTNKRDPLALSDHPEETEWAECESVDMDVEVVEGSMKPKEVLLQALEILQNKLYRVVNEME